jgi:transposase
MRGVRYTDEFKAEALKQITERGHSAVEVAKRLGITDKSLYRWKSEAERRLNKPDSQDVASLKLEIAKLQKALKRTTEEREILKKAALYFANHPE